MERLTRYNNDGSVDYNDDYTLNEVVAHLAEIENKLESGKLVELPCNIDDYLYVIHLPKLQSELIQCVIVRMEFTGNGWEIKLCESGIGTRAFVCFYDLKAKTFTKGVLGYKVSYPNDIVFTDKSQAEAHLKELQGNKTLYLRTNPLPRR